MERQTEDERLNQLKSIILGKCWDLDVERETKKSRNTPSLIVWELGAYGTLTKVEMGGIRGGISLGESFGIIDRVKGNL